MPSVFPTSYKRGGASEDSAVNNPILISSRSIRTPLRQAGQLPDRLRILPLPLVFHLCPFPRPKFAEEAPRRIRDQVVSPRPLRFHSLRFRSVPHVEQH